MMKLPTLMFTEKLEIWFSLPHQNQELNLISTVRTENGLISRGSQSGVSLVRDLWRKGFTKKVSFEFRVKDEGVMDGESGEEKDGLR